MPGPLKTEAVVLRSMRYGEADRILHVYTPMRGRVGAIAKGVRRARSRFGGRLEPYFRLNLGLHEGRSDLLTVTSAETIEPYPRLREDARRARRRRARVRRGRAAVRLRRGAPEVFHLLCTYLALLDARPAAATPAPARRAAPEAAARGGVRAAARGVRLVRRGRARRRVLGDRGRSRLRDVRGVGVRDRRADALLPDGLAQPAARRGAGGQRARRAARRPRGRRRPRRTMRMCGCGRSRSATRAGCTRAQVRDRARCENRARGRRTHTPDPSRTRSPSGGAALEEETLSPLAARS